MTILSRIFPNSLTIGETPPLNEFRGDPFDMRTQSLIDLFNSFKYDSPAGGNLINFNHFAPCISHGGGSTICMKSSNTMNNLHDEWFRRGGKIYDYNIHGHVEKPVHPLEKRGELLTEIHKPYQEYVIYPKDTPSNIYTLTKPTLASNHVKNWL